LSIEADDYVSYECSIAADGQPYVTFEEDDYREPGFFFSVTGL
jgi:hypothetical protein